MLHHTSHTIGHTCTLGRLPSSSSSLISSLAANRRLLPSSISLHTRCYINTNSVNNINNWSLSHHRISSLSLSSLTPAAVVWSTSNSNCNSGNNSITSGGITQRSFSKKPNKKTPSTSSSTTSTNLTDTDTDTDTSATSSVGVNVNDPVHSNNIPIHSNTSNTNINMSKQPSSYTTSSGKDQSSQSSSSSPLPEPQQQMASIASEKSSVPISPMATSSQPMGSKESQGISQPCSSSSAHAPQPSSSRSFSTSSSSASGDASQQQPPQTHNVPKVPTSAISGSWSTSGAPAYTDVTDASRGDSQGAPQPPAGFDTISGSRSKEMREKFGTKSSSPSGASSTNTSTSINTSGDVPSSGGSPPRRSFATWSATPTDNFSRSTGTGTGTPEQQQQQPPPQQTMSPQGQQDKSGKAATTTGQGMTTRGTVNTAMGGMGVKSDIPSSSGVHESIWQTSYPLSSSHLPSFGALTNNISTDVVIVGAGISGLTTAYELTRRGRDVVIVDGMTCIGGGETGRTSAHLASYLDDGVAELVRRYGVEKTRAIFESHAQAIDTIEAISKRHGIDCDFARVDGFLFPKDAMLKEGQGMDDEIKREWDAIGQCKVFAQAELVDRVTSIEGLNTGKAIRFPNQAQFHPLKYLYGLAKVLTEQKSDGASTSGHSGSEGKIGSCRIFCSTQIIKYEGGKDAWVESASHHKVSANHIVMATNVPLQLINLIDSVKPMRSYVIGAPIPSKYAEEHSALWWDTADPYRYVRIMMNDKSKNDDDRYIMIVGGEDHVVGRDEGRSANERYNALESWARERWPMMGGVNTRWSGQVEEPVDCIAYIGVNPHDHSNVYICTGDSGEGLTHGTIAGGLITDLITKTKNKYESIYDPKRHLSLAAASSYIQHNVVTQFQFGRWLKSSEINDIEDLRPCHGAVIREGLAPVAVYRDSNGCTHKMSAVCPHLKGVVRWNNDEQSWDCPVHGSRFTATGKVIHGPSKEGLAPISCTQPTSSSEPSLSPTATKAAGMGEKFHTC